MGGAGADDPVRGTYRVKDENREAPKAENVAAGMSGDAAVNNMLGAVNEPPARVGQRAGREITDVTVHEEMREQLDFMIRRATTYGCGRVANVLKALRENFYAD
jgi:hypothetical protein